jgi:hypothetical protein
MWEVPADRLLALPTKIRKGWEGLAEINTSDFTNIC